jgi:hypothetical protein
MFCINHFLINIILLKWDFTLDLCASFWKMITISNHAKNMLTILSFNLLYYKLQLCFKQHLNCTTFTYYKRLINIKKTQNYFLLEKTSSHRFLIFSMFFYMCIIVPHYYQKIKHQKVCISWKSRTSLWK